VLARLSGVPQTARAGAGLEIGGEVVAAVASRHHLRASLYQEAVCASVRKASDAEVV
jgi:hypothetical protein